MNVVGHGLRASAEYRCRFSHPVFGTVVSELSRPFGAFNLQCQTPAIPVGACLAVSVDELRGGSLAPLAATAAGGSRVAIVAQALVSGVTPASITTDGGAVVTVTAAGLDPQGVYVCRHRACSVVVWLCGCVAVWLVACVHNRSPHAVVIRRYQCMFVSSDGAFVVNGSSSTPVAATPTSLQCVTPSWEHGGGPANLALLRLDEVAAQPGWQPALGCSAHMNDVASVVTGSAVFEWTLGSISFAQPSVSITTQHSHATLVVERTGGSVGALVASLLAGDDAATATVVRSIMFASSDTTVSTSIPLAELAALGGSSLADDALGFYVHFYLQVVSVGGQLGTSSATTVAVCGTGGRVLTLGTDAPVCVACPTGHYASGEDVLQCDPCPKNTCVAAITRGGVRSHVGALTLWMRCRYATNDRTVNCTACPAGSSTAQTGATSVQDCRCSAVGFYRTTQDTCAVCDDGDPSAVCVEYEAETGSQVLAPGWWLPPAALDGYASNVTGLPKPSRCPESSTACLGGSATGTCDVGYEGTATLACASIHTRATVTCRPPSSVRRLLVHNLRGSVLPPCQ